MTTKKYKLAKKLRAIYLIIGIIAFLLSLDHNYKTFSTIMTCTGAIAITLLIVNEIVITLYRKKINEQLAVKQLEELEKK